MEISSAKNVKSTVFHGQEQLFARGSFAVSVFRKPEANKYGARGRKSGVMSLTRGKDSFVAKLN